MRDVDYISEILFYLSSLGPDAMTRFQELAGSNITVNNFYSTVDVNEQRIDIANGHISNSNIEFETEERVIASRGARTEGVDEKDGAKSGPDGSSSEENRKASSGGAAAVLILRLIEFENERSELKRRCESLDNEVGNLRDRLASSRAEASGCWDELIVASSQIKQLKDEKRRLREEADEKGEAAVQLVQRIAGVHAAHIIAGCMLLFIGAIVWAWHYASASSDPNDAISALIIGVLSAVPTFISTVSYNKIKAKRAEAISKKTGLGPSGDNEEQ